MFESGKEYHKNCVCSKLIKNIQVGFRSGSKFSKRDPNEMGPDPQDWLESKS